MGVYTKLIWVYDCLSVGQSGISRGKDQMEAKMSFRLSDEEQRFVFAEALKASKPVKGGMVKPSEYVRSLIAQAMKNSKAELREAA